MELISLLLPDSCSYLKEKEKTAVAAVRLAKREEITLYFTHFLLCRETGSSLKSLGNRFKKRQSW